MKRLGWWFVHVVLAALLWSGVAQAREPDWPSSLTIGTAAPGGTYAVYGEGLARILTRALNLPVSVGLYSFVVARSDLPDTLVHAIANAAFANREALIEAHAAAAEPSPANFTRNAFLPFHRGASRWYSDRAVAGVVRGD